MKKNQKKVPNTATPVETMPDGENLGGPLDRYTNVTPKPKKNLFDENFTLLDFKLLTDKILG